TNNVNKLATAWWGLPQSPPPDPTTTLPPTVQQFFMKKTKVDIYDEKKLNRSEQGNNESDYEDDG
ncbi:hypothetical protein PF001_g32616, partial [Phytophthora fragariae]